MKPARTNNYFGVTKCATIWKYWSKDSTFKHHPDAKYLPKIVETIFYLLLNSTTF